MAITPTLQPLALTIPIHREKVGRKTVERLTPMQPVLDFLRECTLIDDGVRGAKNKLTRLKTFLIQRHLDVFGIVPEENTPLQVIKARCAYRIQHECYRIAGERLSDGFLKNYNAMMRFNDAQPYSGCNGCMESVGNMLLAAEGRSVSMTAINNVQPIPRVESSPSKRITSKGIVFGKYPPTAIVRWYGSKGARVHQIEKALNILGLVVATPTIRGNIAVGKRNEQVPSLNRTEVEELLRALPEDEKKKRGERIPRDPQTPKPPKKERKPKTPEAAPITVLIPVVKNLKRISG